LLSYFYESNILFEPIVLNKYYIGVISLDRTLSPSLLFLQWPGHLPSLASPAPVACCHGSSESCMDFFFDTKKDNRTGLNMDKLLRQLQQ
jgi:hypothetical protein